MGTTSTLCSDSVSATTIGKTPFSATSFAICPSSSSFQTSTFSPTSRRHSRRRKWCSSATYKKIYLCNNFCKQTWACFKFLQYSHFYRNYSHQCSHPSCGLNGSNLSEFPENKGKVVCQIK